MTTGTLPAPQVENPTAAPVYELNAEHRCDLCGAQAYVETQWATTRTFDGSNKVIVEALLWCAHHYTKFEPGMAMDSRFRGITKDEREKLVTSEVARKAANPDGNGFS